MVNSSGSMTWSANSKEDIVMQYSFEIESGRGEPKWNILNLRTNPSFIRLVEEYIF